MFDDLMSTLRADPSRIYATLPGLRVRALVPMTIFFPLLLVVPFCLMGFVFSVTDPSFRLQRGETLVAPGHVVAMADCRHGDDEIRYAFTPADGQEYQGARSVCGKRDSVTARLETGDPLPIRYLVSDPSVNSPAAELSNGPPAIMVFVVPFFFILFFVVMFSPLLLPTLREVWRVRRIARHGIVAKAEILYVKSRPGSAMPNLSPMAADIFITYRGVDGSVVEARAKCANSWLVNQLTPGMGVHIAYRPSQPASAILLEAYLR